MLWNGRNSILQNIFSCCFILLAFTSYTAAQGRVAFEKLTDLDYKGETYYTIRNLSLYECQGWCREEPECQAASFSFVVNPLTPRQETVCLLQNGTAANNPSAQPLKAVSQYYMVKMSVRSDKVCKRPWNFERVPNKNIEGHDKALIFTSTKEACLAACLNEENFVCRSVEYNYVTLQCRLSDYDRRTPVDDFKPIELVDAPGIDYFENLCLVSETTCADDRSFSSPRVGVPDSKIALHVNVHFYTDKELMANSPAACQRACEIENEFLCRSYLYLGPPTGSQYNCRLYHLDHWTLPDGPSTFLLNDRPLIDNGGRIGTYYENRCKKPSRKRPKSLDDNDDSMLCKRVVTKDRRYITQITCYEKGKEGGSQRQAMRMPLFGKQGGGVLSSLFSKIGRQGSLPGDFDTTVNPGGQNGNFQFGSGGVNGGGSGATGFPTGGSNFDEAPNGGFGGNGVNGGNGGPGTQFGGGNGVTGPGADFGQNGVGGNGFGPNGGAGGGFPGGAPGGPDDSENDIDTGDNDDVNCDYLGTCYDVSVHCKDTRIVVNVGTNKPFSGRIYALGRSETCNVDVINSDTFRLDLTMAGQDCNTQSAGGVYTNTVVVQRHSVVMTKTDKIYKVRCTYDTSSKNITFGMMPIRDPDMISITSAPEAPAPRIRILDARQKEVETVRIGDRLTFRIEIPDKTPYGIFARNCVAMAKDSRSTFPIIDENGCPVDPTIFPRFTPDGTALQSVYEAFRFTESYGVIFQCNVKYCLGPCEPAVCTYGRENFESWGRKKRELSKRSVDTVLDQAMSLSREIIVLDFGDEATSPYDFDRTTPRPGSNLTDFKVDAVNWPGTSEESFASSTEVDTCPTRTSVLALSVVCALLLVIYICTMFYFCMRKVILQNQKERDVRNTTIFRG